jgi:hypothetical protein
MVVEQEVLPFLSWLPHALLIFASIVVGMGLVGLFIGYLVAAVRHGPGEGFYAVAGVLSTGIPDLVLLSPRRTWAMTRLAIQESLRNRVLVAFGVFALILLFGAWYIDIKNDDPARLYLSVVLGWSNFLILVLVLVLSAFSLPNDIKNRTIYTVVTKPVRAGEIVLGRILGFSAIGTALLAVMCLVSYVFVIRGLDHDHTLDPKKDLAEVTAGAGSGGAAGGQSTTRTLEGRTSFNSHHRHAVKVTVTEDSDGKKSYKAATDTQMRHTHDIQVVGDGDNVKFEIGPPEGALQARVPVYGKLRFVDRSGRPADKGINVGNEWGYRSYIEGDSGARAIWTFSGITESRFRNGLPVELTLRVFRTHKGRIEDKISGEIWLRNPDPAKSVESVHIPFVSAEFSTQQLPIPRKLVGVNAEGQPLGEIDLFDDLVYNGKVEIWMRCAERGQFFGMAQADAYLRAADRPFFLNVVKGFANIWLQMIIVTCMGVMFSTFLSGAVSMMATLASIVLGFFTQFVTDVADFVISRYPFFARLFNLQPEQGAPGGGPIESAVRLFTQQSIATDLDETWANKVMQAVDLVLMLLMRLVAFMLPDFRSFGTVDYVAYGYNISGDLLAQHCAATLAFMLVLATISYFCLRTRELAA